MLFLVNSFFNFKIKDILKPLEANYKVNIFKLETCILLFKDKKYNLITLISTC
jgi:hypothetical protein